jgi:transposase-like protein
VEPRQRGTDSDLAAMAARDRRLAEAARHDAQLERPVAEGMPDHPHPDIAAADHLRAQSDVRSFERQSGIAEQQGDTAEQLRDNRRALRDSDQTTGHVQRALADRDEEVRELERDAERLREETRELGEIARAIQPPSVDE